MAKRLGLPLADDRTPTVDAVRRRLGGRAASDAGAGDLVAFAAPRGGDRLGVVLFARGDDLDVWIDDGLVRRMARGETRGADVSPPRELAEIADAVRAFAALAEGQRVRFHEQARVAEGRL
ncbi:MAG TPA: hypothetical protein VHB21_00585, partial [Minicystis sp.]|nr:hypothetical protein [Minicystis sp.]